MDDAAESVIWTGLHEYSRAGHGVNLQSPIGNERVPGRVSGLAQPTFVLDIPGGHGKVPVGPAYLSEDGRKVEDPWGEPHALDG